MPDSDGTVEGAGKDEGTGGGYGEAGDRGGMAAEGDLRFEFGRNVGRSVKGHNVRYQRLSASFLMTVQPLPCTHFPPAKAPKSARQTLTVQSLEAEITEP